MNGVFYCILWFLKSRVVRLSRVLLVRYWMMLLVCRFMLLQKCFWYSVLQVIVVSVISIVVQVRLLVLLWMWLSIIRVMLVRLSVSFSYCWWLICLLSQMLVRVVVVSGCRLINREVRLVDMLCSMVRNILFRYRLWISRLVIVICLVSCVEFGQGVLLSRVKVVSRVVVRSRWMVRKVKGLVYGRLNLVLRNLVFQSSMKSSGMLLLSQVGVCM